MKTKGKGKTKNTSHASTIGTSNMLILVVDIPRFFLFCVFFWLQRKTKMADTQQSLTHELITV